MIKETFNKFAALMEGVNNDAVKNAFLNFQKSLEYCIEENTVMREVLRDKYKCKKLQLTGGRMIAPLPQDNILS